MWLTTVVLIGKALKVKTNSIGYEVVVGENNSSNYLSNDRINWIQCNKKK